MDKKLDRFDLIVNGNGVPGHKQRIEDLEEWKTGHPQVCPHVLKRGDILKVRALEISVFAVVIAALETVLKLAGVL